MPPQVAGHLLVALSADPGLGGPLAHEEAAFWLLVQVITRPTFPAVPPRAARHPVVLLLMPHNNITTHHHHQQQQQQHQAWQLQATPKLPGRAAPPRLTG